MRATNSVSSPSASITVSDAETFLRVKTDPRRLRAAIMLLTILLASILFKLWLTPAEGLGPYSFVITPDILQRLSELLKDSPLELLLP